ncbi:MAG: methyl-accepting chemotaxis protein, partial [Verrucomicrobiota bacterium]
SLVGLGGLYGLRDTSAHAEEALESAELAETLKQCEVDHLSWARELSRIFLEEEVSEILVETDSAACGLGKWLRGEERRLAEASAPELRPLFAGLMEPHEQLHRSAVRIGELYRQPHAGLEMELRRRYEEHLEWANSLAAHLAMALEVSAAGEAEHSALELELDPRHCGLGRFLLRPETTRLRKDFPELDEALSRVEQPHQRLHRSAVEINELLAEGRVDEAMRHFRERTLVDLDGIGAELRGVIAAENQREDAARHAMTVYQEETKVALADVRGRLGAIVDLTVENSEARAEEMRQGARQTGWSISLLVTVALVVAGGLSWLVSRSVNRPLLRLAGVLSQGATQTSAAASQVSSTSHTLAEGANQQAASLEESSASIEEVASMARGNSEHAGKASQMLSVVKEAIEGGATEMEVMQSAMDGIEVAGREVAKITQTVDEIAFQTNLLALNAAIEAARAGSAGAGFAVVADEVRQLAMRSADAAEETARKIEEAMSQTARGGDISRRVVHALKDVEGQTRELEGFFLHVAQASAEQTHGISQINLAISQLDQVTQQNAAFAEENAGAAEELNGQAKAVQDAVDQLRALVGASTFEKFAAERPARRGAQVSIVSHRSLEAPRPLVRS